MTEESGAARAGAPRTAGPRLARRLDRPWRQAFRRAVDWVTGNDISGVWLFEHDGLFLLFRDHHPTLSGAFHGGNEDVISYYVELLLVITSGVRRSRKACKIDQGGTANVIGYGLEGELQSVA